MIKIINRGQPDNAVFDDQRIYDLMINNELIVSFMHCRNQGLEACLSLAARAIRIKAGTQDDDS